MTDATPPVATLGGVELAGGDAITWRLQTGTAPYVTTLAVHESVWPTLRSRMGEPLTLRIVNSSGVTFDVEEVYILHVVPSPGPRLVTFMVADKRWKWAYTLIARDYNIPKKTGLRTAFGQVPVQTTVDQYQYRRSSLNAAGERWTAEDAVIDVLDQLEPGGGYVIDSFPVEGGEGSLSLQNLNIRDQGHVALQRMLQQIPGAELFVTPDGQVVVFDGADLAAAEAHRASLPPATWDGDKSEMIDRKAIRPAKVFVHYQREVECAFTFEDDYRSETVTRPDRNAPYLENVIQTTDTETEVEEYDPESDSYSTKTVPAGTWVEIRTWLVAMNARRPSGAPEWKFELIRMAWVNGDLDGVLMGGVLDTEDRADVSLRIQAIKNHFRQTFRPNRRYMERVREIEAVRVAVLDPITGARAPSPVWGQASVIPTVKGQRMIGRVASGGETTSRMTVNIDSIPTGSERLIDKQPGPARITILDHDLGVFHLEWIMTPYGLQQAFYPFKLVSDDEADAAPIGDLALQDEHPIGFGVKVAGGSGIFAAKQSAMRTILTIVPAAPNNARQFHRVEVSASLIAQKFRGEFRIENGEGPDAHVFVPPGEADARFGWQDDTEANATLVRLLGLDSDDPNQAGIEETHLPGFVAVNAQIDDLNEIAAHSQAMAAEVLASFADSIQGRVATTLTADGVTLKGNMHSVAVHVAGYPSGKVAVLHEFPGQQKHISRMALLPAPVRRLLLGIVDTGIGA